MTKTMTQSNTTNNSRCYRRVLKTSTCTESLPGISKILIDKLNAVNVMEKAR